jgi:hypothetical protein
VLELVSQAALPGTTHPKRLQDGAGHVHYNRSPWIRLVRRRVRRQEQQRILRSQSPARHRGPTASTADRTRDWLSQSHAGSRSCATPRYLGGVRMEAAQNRRPHRSRTWDRWREGRYPDGRISAIDLLLPSVEPRASSTDGLPASTSRRTTQCLQDRPPRHLETQHLVVSEEGLRSRRLRQRSATSNHDSFRSHRQAMAAPDASELLPLGNLERAG